MASNKKKILKNYLNNKISFIHGDFCFSNILFKNIGEKTSVKLIDPRGSFGKFLNMGDMYYDLAKLRHSLNGAYEYIIYDKFKILNIISSLETDFSNFEIFF